MKKIFNNVLLILMSILVFGYTGILRQEQYLIVTITFVIMCLGFVVNLFYIHKPRTIFLLLSFYMIFNVMFTYPTIGYKYLLVFFTGSFFYLIAWKKEMIVRIFKLFMIITDLFLLATFINYFYPSIIIDVFGRVMSPEQIETYHFGQTWGVPGLPGELSFNAFVISLGLGLQLNAFSFESEKNNKVKKVIMIALFGLGIILTGKRSALLLLPFLSIAVLLPRQIINLSFSKFFVLLSSFTIFPILIINFFMDKIEMIILSGKGTSPLSNRELYWNIAFNMIKEKKFLGHGLYSYDLRFNQLRNHAGFAGAHNSFLQLIAELGIIGGSLYILFIIYNIIFSIRIYFNAIKENQKLEAFISGVSIFVQLLCIGIGVSESIFYQPQQLFTYLMFSGLCFSISKKNKEKLNENFSS